MNAVELKNLDRLQKSMTSLLKGFGISSVELGNEYAYYFISESVTFKLTYTLVDSWFDEFISKRFNIAIGDLCDSFVLSLLHEVGHHMTGDSIPDDIQTDIDKKKDKYQKWIDKKFMPKFLCKKIEFEYFTLFDELMATRWAVWYYRNHPKEVKEMKLKAQSALHRFYADNNVTND